MSDVTNSPGITSQSPAVGAEAIGRILEIARQQLGAEAAFVVEIGDGSAAVRFTDGAPDAVPDELALARICVAMTDGTTPSIVPDSALEPSIAGIDAVGSIVAVPITMTDGASFGMLACVSRHSDGLLRNADSGMVRVLARAIGRLVEQHGLARPAARRAEVERIRTVLDGTGLAMVFQPIVELETHTPAGFEALARFQTEPQRTPDRWFAEAARVDLGADLEMTAVNAALRSLELIEPLSFLSINASTATVARPEFFSVVDGIRPGRLVVELTDHAHIEDDRTLGKALATLGAAGVLIATDVSDAGFETLSHLLQLAPDIIKLDGILIRGIDTDPVRRALASTIVSFAREIGARVIGESIQTDAELSMLRALGVTHGQGNLLGPPAPLV